MLFWVFSVSSASGADSGFGASGLKPFTTADSSRCLLCLSSSFNLLSASSSLNFLSASSLDFLSSSSRCISCGVLPLLTVFFLSFNILSILAFISSSFFSFSAFCSGVSSGFFFFWVVACGVGSLMSSASLAFSGRACAGSAWGASGCSSFCFEKCRISFSW